MSREASED